MNETIEKKLQPTRNEYHEELAFMIALQHYGKDCGHFTHNFAAALQMRYRAELFQIVDNCMAGAAIDASMSLNRFVVEVREEVAKHSEALASIASMHKGNSMLLARHYLQTRTKFAADMLQRLEKGAADFYLSRIFKE